MRTLERWTVHLALGCAMLLAGPSRAADETGPRMVEPAPGIAVMLRPTEGRFDDANTAWIEAGGIVVIVDAPSDPEATAAMIARARERGVTPRYLIDTHWHADHTEGNARYRAAFGAALTIVGHETLREDVPGRAGKDHAERVATLRERIPAARAALAEGKGLAGQTLDEAQRERQQRVIERSEAWLAAHGDARFEPPDLTYDSRLTLDLPGRRIELHHFEAHTRGDSVVWLPDDGVLFTGDLFDELPYVGHGTPRSWLAALETIAAWPVKTFVPGHGGILDTGRLELERGYLRDLVRQVDEARAAGRTLEQAKETIDLSAWRDRLARDDAARRFFDGTVGEAIDAAWREADGG